MMIMIMIPAVDDGDDGIFCFLVGDDDGDSIDVTELLVVDEVEFDDCLASTIPFIFFLRLL